ncbi:MAG TPA: DUF2806 domain-containing protein [Vicinamibacteria bacterium]|nr:DUF2806 domain-containing protein [Vicinamibacteria bacterium]
MGDEENRKALNVDIKVDVGLDKLIETIGAHFEPQRIVRVARAEAEAALIKDNTGAKLLARAEKREQQRKIRQQQNVEAIVGGAVPLLLPEHVSGEKVDPDWTAAFFDYAQDVSDAKMRILWSKILAGEVSQPGTFSRRTLAAVGLLSQGDADLFTEFCSYVWTINGFGFHVQPDHTRAVLEAAGIEFAHLTHLASVGLVTFESIVLMHARLDDHKPNLFAYQDRTFEATIEPGTGGAQRVSVIPLTTVGTELAPISGAKFDEPYLTRCLAQFEATGIRCTPK